MKRQLRSGTRRHLYARTKVAVLHAKTTDKGWDQQRLVIHVLKSLICMHKTTREGWNPYSHFILGLSTLLCVLITTDEVRDPYRLVSLVPKSLFWMKKKKEERWGLEPIWICRSGENHAVFQAQNDRWGLGPIETCNSAPKGAGLQAKATDKGLDP